MDQRTQNVIDYNLALERLSVQESDEPLYSLSELRALAAQYADERHCEARLTVQLSLGCFVEWLAKREQGKE